MRRTLLALCLVLAFTATAATDKAVTVWTAKATNGSAPVDTAGYGEAQVTVGIVSGSPDGTVTVYSVPPGGLPLVFLGSTTPSAWAVGTKAKTLRGPVGTSIVVALTGMTTGAVGVAAVLK